MKTIYAIVGDYYHPGDLIQQSLSLAMKPLTDSGQYELAYVSAEDLTDRLLSKPAAVILFKEDRVNPKDDHIEHWLTEPLSTAITRYVEEGGGFLAWHSGLASYPPDSAFIQMLRGYFEHHPSKHQVVSYKGVLPSEPSREISFEIVDEHYFVSCDEANTDIFLKSESVDGSSIGGWAHSFGQGQVCCLTPAHNKEGLLHPGMIELLRSSVLRCCESVV
ncbi:ThuA domain-containing protein [Paenibacillus agricola]|uniref:ThuA domain-containing protein n=1 Tax=Paenibacillus agricola TaxID=2716264 RepID=A0ABX0JHY1_9BACL|nr:ThuA domain-containing protein [Paenibacillus agricola]NHN33999.1 ThuA domain-containing protein [Paenibacillus agricola]